MRPLFYVPLLFLLASCGGGTPQKTAKDSTADRPAKISASDVQPEETYYVEVTHVDVRNFVVSIQSAFGVGMRGTKGNFYPRDSLRGNILIVADKKTNKRDTVDVHELQLMPYESSKEYIRITDVTRETGFDKLALVLYWINDESHKFSGLIGYMKDTLQKIGMSLDEIVDLKRKDRWTLTGHCWGDDEITGVRDPTFLMTISLKTFERDVKTPDTLVTKFETEAADTIHTYRLFRSGVSAPYTIRPGAQFRIDTVLTKLQTVIISIGDSIVLRAPSEQIQDKLKWGAAG